MDCRITTLTLCLHTMKKNVNRMKPMLHLGFSIKMMQNTNQSKKVQSYKIVFFSRRLNATYNDSQGGVIIIMNISASTK